MSKVSRMTHVTPLPQGVSRKAAIAYLQDHEQMIELNPLVLRHQRTFAPDNADPDEAQSMIWYEITDEIQYIPGTPLKGEVTYKAGFYDTPTGLQTHTFAPGGVDLRGKWSIGGNAPGEAKEEVEIGSNKPREGLYVQEDVELRCNVLLTNFVKKNLKKSHATVVDSIVKKVAVTIDGIMQHQRPEHGRSKSDMSGLSQHSLNNSANWASTPTSYNRRGSNPCNCSMAAFGVHMEQCQFYPNLRQTHSEEQGREPYGANLTMELDGNDVARQHYYNYEESRPHELE